MLKEVCVENFTNIPHVIENGADRIELNNELSLGGTTPTFGVIKRSIIYADRVKIPVIVMIRPRGGNFIYNEDEIAIMADDMAVAAKLGARGVAFGCLTNQKQLNRAQMERLIDLAHSLNLTVVMHMAFDQISEAIQRDELNWLIGQKVERILTHEGDLQFPIEDTITHLKEILNWSNGKIEILPGGGITTKNRDEIAEELHVNQLHGSKIV